MGAATGEHHDWGTVAGDTASMAGTGAAIGSGIVPGIGTAVGAGIGAGVGFFTGLFTGDKPDDPTSSKPPPALDMTDELVRRAAMAQQQRMMAGAGNGTFLTGPVGLPPAPGIGGH